MADTNSSTDAAQGVVALVAITLGAVPLVRVLLGGEVGRLLSWVPGTDDRPGALVVPAVVVVVGILLVAVLERSKSRH